MIEIIIHLKNKMDKIPKSQLNGYNPKKNIEAASMIAKLELVHKIDFLN